MSRMFKFMNDHLVKKFANLMIYGTSVILFDRDS